MARNWDRIGSNIALRRERAGMSRRQLGVAVGVHHSTIKSWETGATKPAFRHLQALAGALGVGVLLPPAQRVRATDALAPLMGEILVMAEDAVLAAGGAAMRHFVPVPVDDRRFGSQGNPKLLADAAANEAMLKSVVPDLRHIAARAGCKGVVFTEELAADRATPFGARVEVALEKLPADDTCCFARSSEEFATMLAGGAGDGPRLGVIGDPTDGSGNLELGLGGQFVSAIAILDGSQLLASAIYDPHGAVLYSAAYHPGAPGVPGVTSAEMSHLRAGVTSTLSPSAVFGRRVLSVHASRTAHRERRGMIERLDELVSSPYNPSSNEGLERKLFPGGITAINCGQASLAAVAARRYSAFTSTVTSIWDLAAGDLLLRCCGGVLTDFDGLPIDYGSGPEKVSVIAAWDREVHARLVEKLHTVRDRA